MSTASRTSPPRSRTWILCAVACQAAVVIVPGRAAAQSTPSFTTALTQFAIALGGAYGDEATQATRALDAMDRALPEWDRELATVEQRGRSAAADRQAHVDLARAYILRGRTSDAIRELDAALQRDPASLDTSLMLGLAQANAGHRSEASAAFRAAWRRNRSNPIAAYWLVLGDASPAADDVAPALETLGVATRAALTRTTADATLRFVTFPPPPTDIGDAPLLMPAAYARGYTMLRAGDTTGAVAQFRQAARTDPLLSDPAIGSPALTSGSAALRQGRIATAREQFQAAVAQTPLSSEAHRLLAIACLFDFEPEQSIAELQAAVRLRPDDERSVVLLSRVMTQQGDLQGAESALRTAAARLPDSSLIPLWLASVVVSSNRNDEAARLMSTAAAQHPLAGEAGLWVTIGTSYQNTGELDLATDAFNRSLTLDPMRTETHVRAARAYLEQDKRDQAFAEYAAALLIDPAEPNAQMGIGRLHLDAGRYAEAIPVLQRLVAMQPSFTEAHYALGTALTRVGRKEDGARELAEFARAQAQAAEQRRHALTVDVLKQDALLKTSDGAFDRAEALWKQILELEPNVAAHYASLGAVLVRANRLDGAAAAYERAAALGGGPDVYRPLVSIYARLGRQADSQAARQKFEQALAVPAPTGTHR